MFFLLNSKKVSKSKILASILLFIVAVSVSILPVTARNYHLHRDFILLSAHGGMNFYMGNVSGFIGDSSHARFGTDSKGQIQNSITIAEKSEGRKLKPSEVSSYWFKQTIDAVSKSPVRWLTKTVKKILFIVNHYEYPDVLDMGFASKFVPMLIIGQHQFGVISFLFIMSFFTLRSRLNRTTHLVSVFAIGLLFSMVLVLTNSRYRLPLVPIMILFSAVTVDQMISGIKLRTFTPGIKTLIVSFVTVVIVWAPIQDKLNYAQPYNSLGIWYKNKGEFAIAEKYYNEAMSLQPNYPSPYYNIAKMYSEMGKNEEVSKNMARYHELKKQFGF